MNSVKNKRILTDYLNEFLYNILAKSQLEIDLVSEIILMLSPPGDHRILKKY